jgi:hypothetical protein
MSEACKLSTEALEMINKVNAKMINADEHIVAEHAHASTNICNERLLQ